MDPAYPLYPILCFICATLLTFILWLRLKRGRLNFGICTLCLCVILHCIIYGVGAIVWARDADIKAVVWCDIVTHVQMFITVSKPACSLIITRDLYLAVNTYDSSFVNTTGRKPILTYRLLFNFVIGIVIPTLSASIFYYIVQDYRFEVIGGLGCQDVVWPSGVNELLLSSWPILFPTISILFYCPSIIKRLYPLSRRNVDRELSLPILHNRDLYKFCLALGILDIIFTLPVGVVNLIQDFKLLAPLPFVWYPGWGAVHDGWDPVSVSQSDWIGSGFWNAWNFYFGRWSNIVLGFAMFIIFMLESKARSEFKNLLVMPLRPILRRASAKAEPTLSSQIQFGEKLDSPRVDVSTLATEP